LNQNITIIDFLCNIFSVYDIPILSTAKVIWSYKNLYLQKPNIAYIYSIRDKVNNVLVKNSLSINNHYH
jgi:hypothetical protein